jgi:hypothetical protein
MACGTETGQNENARKRNWIRENIIPAGNRENQRKGSTRGGNGGGEKIVRYLQLYQLCAFPAFLFWPEELLPQIEAVLSNQKELRKSPG